MMTTEAIKPWAPSGALKSILLRYGVYIIFLGMILFFSLTNPRFLTINNALLILQQAAPLGIAAIGMTFVIVIAGIDISVGQNMYLSAIMVALVMESLKASNGFGTVAIYVLMYGVAVVVGAAVGAFNGLLISRFRIVPFIATLASMGIARGLGLLGSNSTGYFVSELGGISNGRIANIPYVAIIMLILALVFDYVLRRTPYGRHLMAIGNDPNIAQKIGINVHRNVFIAYLICGAMAGLAGVMSAGQIGYIAVYFAEGNEFLVIAAVVLGGTSLFGGKGSVFPGALIGILLVTALVNGMAMLNTSPYAYTIIRGAIIFLAVMVDSVNYRGELR